MISRLLIVAFVAAAVASVIDGGNIWDELSIDWEPENARFSEDGSGASLSLVSSSSGCRLRTKKTFLYGTVSALIQLVRGNSASTVTTFYTSSVGEKHDEIDFEFLGNETGQPYTIHTNLFVADIGNKEMQFKPWFDPAANFHNYTISWSPCLVVWYIDGIPIRVFRNCSASHGVPYPITRPMYGYSSIWASGNWATQGGRVRTDWTKAPFIAKYRDVDLDVCMCTTGGGCATHCPRAAHGGECRLSAVQLGQMRALQDKYRIYNYCLDYQRFNGQMPTECSLPQY